MRFTCTKIEWDAYDEDEEVRHQLPEEYELEVSADELEEADDDWEAEGVIEAALESEIGYPVLYFEWKQID